LVEITQGGESAATAIAEPEETNRETEPEEESSPAE
jgi:hypothetical protein